MSLCILMCRKCKNQTYTVELDLENKEAKIYCNKCGESNEINELLGKRKKKPAKSKTSKEKNNDVLEESETSNTN